MPSPHSLLSPCFSGRRLGTCLFPNFCSCCPVDAPVNCLVLADRGLYNQSYGSSSGHVWMWELDCKEGWAPKNWCFWTVVLEKTLESPLDCKEIQPVHPKGNQSWIFIGRTDAEAEIPILWPPDVKSWLIWKYPDVGKDRWQEENGTTEDKMVGWYHWLNGCELEQILRDGEGEWSLMCCSPWGHESWNDWQLKNYSGCLMGLAPVGLIALLTATPKTFLNHIPLLQSIAQREKIERPIA